MTQSRPVSDRSSFLNPERRLLAQIDRSPFNHIERSDVPARASARPAQSMKIQPKYALIARRIDGATETDITEEKTVSPAECVVPHEALRHQPASSAPALDEIATTPETLIDEVDTVPFSLSTFTTRKIFRKRPSDISEIRTSPPLLTYQIPARIARALHQERISEVATFRPLSEKKIDKLLYPEFRYPWDRLRWWLLRPGRIEYVLWLVGTVLLLCFTAGMLCAVLLSLLGNSSFTCLF